MFNIQSEPPVWLGTLAALWQAPTPEIHRFRTISLTGGNCVEDPSIRGMSRAHEKKFSGGRRGSKLSSSCKGNVLYPLPLMQTEESAKKSKTPLQKTLGSPRSLRLDFRPSVEQQTRNGSDQIDIHLYPGVHLPQNECTHARCSNK